jgi:tetratricopeptide (TPR) repeat protein
MSQSSSLCMIVRNEEAVLPTCLRSVADLVAEMVIVDTGSTDRTKEVAAELGARVFDFPWQDDFAAARNESLRQASGGWIFWLDADEFLDEVNREKLRALFASLKEENAAFVMAQRSPLPNGSATRVPQVRLFRKSPGANAPGSPGVRWEYRVHEQLLPSLRRAGYAVLGTDIVIQHSGYQLPAAGPRKLERNLRLLLLDEQERPGDPFTLFNLGSAYLQLGRFAEAVPLLQRSLDRSQPGDSIVPKLYAALAAAHERLGQRGQALALLRQAQARCPGEASLLFLEGQLQRAAGNPAAAEACWRQVSGEWRVASGESESKPLVTRHSPLGLFVDVEEGLPLAARQQLALLCQESGRAEEAEHLWRELVAEKPGFLPAWAGLGELLLERQDWPAVEEIAGRLEAEPAGQIEALVLRGRACLARKEFDQARTLLGEAISRAPAGVMPRLYLSHVWLQEGRDLAAAEQALRTLLTLAPQETPSWRNLAVLLRQQGRLPEAVTACASGLSSCPDDPELLLLHGQLLHETGALRAAEATFVQLLEREATAPAGGNGAARQVRQRRATARHNLALLCRGQGRLAEAEKHWRAALEAEPEFQAAWLGLGELALANGRPAEAQTCITRLESAVPGSEPVVFLRARLLWKQRQHPEARRLLEDFLTQAPRSKPALQLLSYVLLDEGKDLTAAERVLRAFLLLDPKDAEAQHNLSILSRRQGRTLAG